MPVCANSRPSNHTPCPNSIPATQLHHPRAIPRRRTLGHANNTNTRSNERALRSAPEPRLHRRRYRGIHGPEHPRGRSHPRHPRGQGHPRSHRTDRRNPLPTRTSRSPPRSDRRPPRHHLHQHPPRNNTQSRYQTPRTTDARTKKPPPEGGGLRFRSINHGAKAPRGFTSRRRGSHRDRRHHRSRRDHRRRRHALHGREPR